MKFLVDAHFPRRLSYWLIENGEDSIHTLDLPKKNKTSDLEIIKQADQENRIVITKDSDFYRYRILKGQPDRLLIISTGNIVNKDLITLFETNFPTLKQLFISGSKVVEIDTQTITVLV